MKAPVWKKVGVDIQTALATALAVSAISKASAAVVSYATTTSDPIAGDYILLQVTGMHELNNVVVRALSVDSTANTFVAEGVDSTLFDTFVAGTMQIITFGQSMSTMMDITASGGDPKYTPTTTIHDEMDTEDQVGFNAVKFTSKSLYKVDDAALLALRAASRTNTPLAVKFRYSNGAKVAFFANVGASMTPTGASGAVVETPLSFSALNFPSYWAT